MALAKIADLYPDYKRDIFNGEDIKGFSVYDYSNDKIGSVHDIIVDETGRFRYLVIDTGFWIFGKKVLLPVGRASVDYSQKRIYAQGLSKEQAETLPEYDEDMTIDYDYEEQVRGVYRGVEYNHRDMNTSSTYSTGTSGYDRDVATSGTQAYDTADYSTSTSGYDSDVTTPGTQAYDTADYSTSTSGYDSDVTTDRNQGYGGGVYSAGTQGYGSGAYDSSSYTYDNDRDRNLYQLNQNNHGDMMGYESNFMNNRDRFNLRSGVSLYKIGDLYPDYRSIFGNDDLTKYSLYGSDNEKVGSVKDILVDQEGNFRYLVVDTGFLGLGKKILLPFGSARFDRSQERVYASGLTKEQAKNLPEYDDDMTVDYDYEERVRNIYRVQSTVPGTKTSNFDTNYDRDSYNYGRDDNLYAHRDHDLDTANDRQSLKLYEERLVANKERFRAGEVSIGKKVKTETKTVSVPVEKERVIIERHTPTDAGRVVAPGEDAFREGEVAHIEVYEEAADIEKETVVREEIEIRKEVEKDVVSAQETVRREELDIDADGNVINNRNV
jgi:uncharacterized protein (TIGR02271 family)